MTKYLLNNTRNTIGNSATALKGNSMLFTNSFVGFPMFFKSIALALAMLVVGIGSSWGQLSTTTYNFNANSTGWTGDILRSTSTSATMCGTPGMRKNLWYLATTGSLVSPLLPGTNNQGVITLSYKYKAANYNYPYGAVNPWGSFNVQVGNSATGPWTTIATVSQQTQTGSCITQTHTFTPPAGNLYIKWNCFWTTGDYYLSFDDVSVSQASNSACSGTPAAGTASASVASVCSSVNFTLNATGLTSGAGISYIWQRSTNGGSFWSDITGATSASATVNQTVNTQYRIRTTCSNSGLSANSNAVTVNMLTGACQCATYCNSNFTNATYEFITNVNFAGINNSSAGNTGGPVNYTGLAGATVLPGNTYPLSVTIDPDGNEYVYVWFDWNQNGVLTDAGEAFTVAANVTAVGPHTINIPVPAGAAVGSTRMRVMVDFNNAVPNPCRSDTYGEAEDYCVTIAAPTPCAGTPNPGATTASTTQVFAGGSATLGITTAQSGSGITYQWQSGASASGPWTTIGGATSATYVASPTAATYYQCVVTCSASGASGASTPILISFNGYCNPDYTGYTGTTPQNGTEGTVDGDMITNVTITQGATTLLNNTSTAALSSPQYTFYSSLPAITMYPSSTYSVNVTAGAFTNQNFAVWIDYNDDNDFYDAGELIGYSSAATTVGYQTISFPINLACTPPFGTHRMRIRDAYATTASTMNPCATYGWGETEDYLITIVAGTPFAPAFTATPSTPNCVGTQVTYTATAGQTNYAWTFPGTAGVDYTLVSGGTSASNTAVVVYNNGGSKTINMNYASPLGCASAGAVTNTITITTPIPVTATVSSTPVCTGTAVTLTANGATSYSWSTGSTASVTSAAPTSTTTYTVTGTDGNGCTSNASVLVTVNASPTANAGADITDTSTCGKNTVNVGGNALAAGQAGQWSVLSATNNGSNQGLFSLTGNAANNQFTGVYGGTYVLQWAVTSGGCTGTDQMTVTFNQPNATSLGVLIGDQDVLWNGLSSSDWSTSNNWYQKQAAGHYIRMTSGQPGTNTEVYTISNAVGGICFGNNMPTLNATSNAEDVYVNTGMSLNLTDEHINLEGNLTNHGTINASTGTINFTGGLSSTISGTGTTSLNNLTVNKSGGQALTVSMPVTVTGVLDMTLGNIFTSTNSILTLGNSSASPGTLSWTSGNIVGPFRRYFEHSVTSGDAGLFPVGTSANNRYARINFTSSPGTNQYLTVRYVPGAPMSGGIPLYNGLPLMITGAMIQNYSADGYWQVDPTGGSYSSSIASTSYDVTLFANNLTGMTTPQICRIIKSPGSASSGSNHVVWQACGTPVAVATGAAPSSFAITSTASTGFSWFNIGSPNGQALPVELMSFSGNCADGQVNLEWQTASEHNSLYFEVEKSRDGENWQVLSTVPSAGNSTELLTYSAVDAHAGEGNNYYRLNQVDIDGANKVYDIINVSCSGGNKGYFSTYPNPSSGSFQVVLNNKEMLGAATLSIRDTKGASLLQREIEVKPGINLFSINDLNLAPGLYYIQVLNGDQTTELIKEVIR